MILSETLAYTELGDLVHSSEYKNLADRVNADTSGSVTVLYSGDMSEPVNGVRGTSANGIIE